MECNGSTSGYAHGHKTDIRQFGGFLGGCDFLTTILVLRRNLVLFISRLLVSFFMTTKKGDKGDLSVNYYGRWCIMVSQV